MEEIKHVLCPVYDYELKLITLITIAQQTVDETENGYVLVVDVLPDPKAIKVGNPDPKTNQVELTISKISTGGYSTATFFAADSKKAMRLPCGFAPGQSLAIAETYNKGFSAGVLHRARTQGN